MVSLLYAIITCRSQFNGATLAYQGREPQLASLEQVQYVFQVPPFCPPGVGQRIIPTMHLVVIIITPRTI